MPAPSPCRRRASGRPRRWGVNGIGSGMRRRQIDSDTACR
jgi:hypothetical protein